MFTILYLLFMPISVTNLRAIVNPNTTDPSVSELYVAFADKPMVVHEEPVLVDDTLPKVKKVIDKIDLEPDLIKTYEPRMNQVVDLVVLMKQFEGEDEESRRNITVRMNYSERISTLAYKLVTNDLTPLSEKTDLLMALRQKYPQFGKLFARTLEASEEYEYQKKFMEHVSPEVRSAYNTLLHMIICYNNVVYKHKLDLKLRDIFMLFDNQDLMDFKQIALIMMKEGHFANIDPKEFIRQMAVGYKHGLNY